MKRKQGQPRGVDRSFTRKGKSPNVRKHKWFTKRHRDGYVKPTPAYDPEGTNHMRHKLRAVQRQLRRDKEKKNAISKA